MYILLNRSGPNAPCSLMHHPHHIVISSLWRCPFSPFFSDSLPLSFRVRCCLSSIHHHLVLSKSLLLCRRFRQYSSSLRAYEVVPGGFLLFFEAFPVSHCLLRTCSWHRDSAPYLQRDRGCLCLFSPTFSLCTLHRHPTGSGPREHLGSSTGLSSHVFPYDPLLLIVVL